jgi:hypothetical protein
MSSMSNLIAWLSSIADQDPFACSSEHQGSSQTSWAATDDDDIKNISL